MVYYCTCVSCEDYRCGSVFFVEELFPVGFDRDACLLLKLEMTGSGGGGSRAYLVGAEFYILEL